MGNKELAETCMDNRCLICKLLGTRASGMMRRRTIQQRGATTTGSKRTWGFGNEEQETNVRKAH
eukprot:646490-Pyramimonas_sp.AAC.1